MCLESFSQEAPCGSILVNDHFPYATTKSLHFGWSFTWASTVIKYCHYRLVCLLFAEKIVCDALSFQFQTLNSWWTLHRRVLTTTCNHPLWCHHLSIWQSHFGWRRDFLLMPRLSTMRPVKKLTLSMWVLGPMEPWTCMSCLLGEYYGFDLTVRTTCRSHVTGRN